MRLKGSTLLSLLILSNMFARANQYPVTSNADLGAGTLREAIAFANSHPGYDSILFNLADTTVAGRTIMLEAPLEEITDRLFIDGTSQPGIPFGISQSKIQLTANNPLIHGIRISEDSCYVLGMFIQNFEKGIIIGKRYNQIGAVGKGNVIFNCTIACIEIFGTNHSAIISNLIGVDTAQQVGNNAATGLRIVDAFAVAVGGKSPDGRNIISGNTYGINMINSKFVDVNANYIGTDLSGLTAIPNQYGIVADSENVNIEIGGDSVYEQNVISGNTFAAIKGKFVASLIQGNFIGTDVTGTAPLGNGTYGIYFAAGSHTNSVGGKYVNMNNKIAFNGSEAVYLEDNSCYEITLFRNSTSCNSQVSGAGGFTLNGGNNNIQPPTILIADLEGVSGIAAPNGIVDVFLDDTCSFCEGGTLVGSVYVEPSGVFKLEMDVTGTITATMSDAAGNSSEYTACTPVGSSTCLITNFILPTGDQCPGTLLQFTDQTVTAPGTNLSTWTWNWGDGNTSTAQNPTHSYATGGDYTISLTTTNTLGCLNTMTKSYSVANIPAAAFISSVPACLGSAISFTDQSTVAEGDTLKLWVWDFGDGGTSSEQNPTHSYSQSGTFTVTLTATGTSCTDNTTSTIQIYDLPVASFSAPLQVCKASDFSFTDLSTAGDGDELSSWFWDFGDGASSEEQNPNHAYADPGTYTVTLSVTGNSGCSDEYSATVEAIDVPIALYTSATISCIENEISFTDQSTTGGDEITSWSWDFGDGATSTDQSPAHSFSVAGTYLVSLAITTSAGCSGEYTSDVIVVDPPSTLFAAVATSCVESEIIFSDQTVAALGDEIAEWQWDFGDGNSSTDKNPVHSFNQSGIFDVVLSVTTAAGCAGQYDTVIQILDQPVASFNFTQAGLTVTFENTSADNGNASYSWDFDDGNSSTEENPSHQYSSGGVYNVCLTVFDSTCMTSSVFCLVVDLPTSIGQVKETQVTIYPNPANDVITISGLYETGIETVTLFNSIGQRIIQANAPAHASELQINTRSLPQGIYTINLRKADESVLQRKINVIH